MQITDKEKQKAQEFWRNGEVIASVAAKKLTITARRAAKVLLAAGFKVKTQGGHGVATVYSRRK